MHLHSEASAAAQKLRIIKCHLQCCCKTQRLICVDFWQICIDIATVVTSLNIIITMSTHSPHRSSAFHPS